MRTGVQRLDHRVQGTVMVWQFDTMVWRQHGNQRHRLSTLWVADDVAVGAMDHRSYGKMFSTLGSSREGRWREANQLWFVSLCTLRVSHTMGLPWCFLPGHDPHDLKIHQHWCWVAYILCWRGGARWQQVQVWMDLKMTEVPFASERCLLGARQSKPLTEPPCFE